MNLQKEHRNDFVKIVFFIYALMFYTHYKNILDVSKKIGNIVNIVKM